MNWVFVRMNAKTKGVKAQHDMRGVNGVIGADDGIIGAICAIHSLSLPG